MSWERQKLEGQNPYQVKQAKLYSDLLYADDDDELMLNVLRCHETY